MRVQTTSLDGLVIVEPILHRDSRGLFFESYKDNIFQKLQLPTTFPQDNISLSLKGVVRGLHFQKPPFEQSKFIRCVKGSIFDVVVDLRLNSNTFGQVETVMLTDANHLALYIPSGFAHGFQTLSEESLVYYRCSQVYSKLHEEGINPLDEALGIRWPLPITELSPKDQALPYLSRLSLAEKRMLCFA